jgi:formate hydrogenlyase subunit 6/NADH:ubiquinone oxidoreductase subunit I
MPKDVPVPGFKYELCTSCGECVESCPEEALALSDGLPRLRQTVSCTYCGLCEDACPTGAIYLTYEIFFAPSESLHADQH